MIVPTLQRGNVSDISKSSFLTGRHNCRTSSDTGMGLAATETNPASDVVTTQAFLTINEQWPFLTIQSYI